MNCYVWMCIFAAVAVQCTNGSSNTPLKINSPTDELKLNNFEANCTKVGLFCKSCSELVMCIETDYGWTEQSIEKCSDGNSCYHNKCIAGRNILCDGTAKIPFKCHVPGAFPDPFDCQAYHLCVLTTENQNEDTVEVLKDFKHTCPSDENVEYRYDAKSTYCKYEISNSCPKLPVPLCKYAGETGALIENDSIYYVCELIENVIYPNLYSCPHGRRFNIFYKRCEFHGDSSTSTAYPSTTTDRPSTTTDRPSTTTDRPSTTTDRPSTTTDYPWTTTDRPSTTTDYPWTTTSYPWTTTSYPWTTTSYPWTTTSYPWTTTSYPWTTTSYPWTTTSYPWTTTSYPWTSEYTTSPEYRPTPTSGYTTSTEDTLTSTPEYTTYYYPRK